MNSRLINTIVLILVLQKLLFIYAQYPESLNITGLANQTQAIYSGWIIGNITSGSSLYYNLYSANTTDANNSDYSSIPLIMYLEGGPGDSSIMTGIMEIGPYISNLINLSTYDVELVVNQYAWTKKYHLLLIDQPVGTGFSISYNNDYVNSTEQAADYLITFLLRFYELYPYTLDMPLYIGGRSYGGKWAPMLAYKLLQAPQFSGINFKGLIIADGLVDPINQFEWAEYSYSAGIFDQKTRDSLLQYEEILKDYALAGDMHDLGLGLTNVQSYLQLFNVTGGIWVNNYREYLSGGSYIPEEMLAAFEGSEILCLLPTSIYRTLFQIPSNVGFNIGSLNVTLPLINADLGNSTKFAVEYVLNQGYNVLVYVGQDDLNLNYPGTLRYLNTLDWEGIHGFISSIRKPWYTLNSATSDDDENTSTTTRPIAGMYKTYENLSFGVVYKAGHLVTADQPASALALIELFIGNQLDD